MSAAPAPWSSQGNFKENWFLPIRLGLALLVILSHSFLLVDGNSVREPLIRVTGIMSIGNVAVDMFLAISGFLVARSWDGSANWRDFMWKRALRVYPAFIAIMAVQAFVLAPLASPGPFHGYSVGQYAMIAFEMIDLVGYGFPYGGLLSPFPDNPLPFEINSSLWSIRYEFVCYLLLAAAGGFRRRPMLFLLFAAALAIRISGWQPPWHWTLTAAFNAVDQWPRLLSFFLAGVIFYRERDRIPRSAAAAAAALLLVATAIATGSRLLLFVGLPTAGVYLLFWAAYLPKRDFLPRIRSVDLSYGVYLCAFPIQQSLMLWLAPHFTLTPLWLAAIRAVLSLLVAAMSWHGIEKRFLSIKERKFRPKASAAPVPPVVPDS